MILQTIMSAGAAQLIYVAARLRLADELARGPASSQELAARVGAEPRTLHRLLRGLVAFDLFREREDGRFELASQGQELRSDVPATQWRTVIEWGELINKAMGGLLHAVKTGERPFEHVFGMSVWEYRARNPELGETFHANVAEATARAAGALVAAYDFASARTVVDVGGGHGALLAAILNACPQTRGILFDRFTDGAAQALAASGVSERCEQVRGDFFQSVPPGADVYLLKAIVHDWSDEEAERILIHCREAMSPRSRLLLLERLMPERAAPGDTTVLSDVLMLVLEHGRERTERDFRALLSRAGFSHVQLLPIDIPDACLIEAW